MAIQRKRRLFIDLDGVGADFDGGYYTKFGHWPSEVDDDTMWANVRSDPEFFATLPVMDGFLEAVREFVEAGYEPVFLTACPEHDYKGIADQKYRWVGRNVPHDLLMIPIVRGKNKARLVHQVGDILVDDFEKNILPWREAGGIGIHHTQGWDKSKEWVHKLMAIPVYHTGGPALNSESIEKLLAEHNIQQRIEENRQRTDGIVKG